MTALGFDARAFLKTLDRAGAAAIPAIPASPGQAGGGGIAELAEIAGRHPRRCVFEDGEPEDWTPACGAIRGTRLPPPGTPERERLDDEQARMLAGLLAQYRRHAGGGR